MTTSAYRNDFQPIFFGITQTMMIFVSIITANVANEIRGSLYFSSSYGVIYCPPCVDFIPSNWIGKLSLLFFSSFSFALRSVVIFSLIFDDFVFIVFIILALVCALAGLADITNSILGRAIQIKFFYWFYLIAANTLSFVFAKKLPVGTFDVGLQVFISTSATIRAMAIWPCSIFMKFSDRFYLIASNTSFFLRHSYHHKKTLFEVGGTVVEAVSIRTSKRVN